MYRYMLMKTTLGRVVLMTVRPQAMLVDAWHVGSSALPRCEVSTIKTICIIGIYEQQLYRTWSSLYWSIIHIDEYYAIVILIFSLWPFIDWSSLILILSFNFNSKVNCWSSRALVRVCDCYNTMIPLQCQTASVSYRDQWGALGFPAP